MRIATKYPRIAERHFEGSGRQAEVIEVKGSVELAPLVGLADGIVDLVDTGRTLEENELEVREEIAVCTARLIANRVAHKLRAAEIDELSRSACGRRRDEAAAVRMGRPDAALATASATSSPPLEEVTEDVAGSSGRPRARRCGPRAEFGRNAPASRRRSDAGRRRASSRWRRPWSTEVREALRVAAHNVGRVAAAQAEAELRPTSIELPSRQPVEVRAAPVAAAAVYVPGGRAPYPSSVLMGCAARPGAGVGRLAVVSPAGTGGEAGGVMLAACALADVDEVYAVGGAQAIAALAYGTETIAPVDVIVGPGNRYVTRPSGWSRAGSGSTRSPGRPSSP